jgi:hypothetical protein
VARRSTALRYVVTGPGVEGEPSFEHPGPALSRTVTAANEAAKKGVDGTWYARDALDDDRAIGYSESDEGLVITVGSVGRSK